MHIKATHRWFIFGGLAGYAVVHPLVMIASRIMTSSVVHVAGIWDGLVMGGVVASFTPKMLPWGLAFALLGAVVSVMIVRQRDARAHEERLQGVLELAGAACHELSQPLQVVMGYAQLLAEDLPQHASLRGQLDTIVEEIDRMSLILRKIQSITRYETLDYIDGVKIIDIEKASRI